MVWSAGQREFVPLLLGLYWLLTSAGAPRRKGLRTVIIEELEMGLHPRAISVVLLMLFDLLSRMYRVIISTHSPQILDALWAFKHLKENHADPSAFLDVFGAEASPAMLKMAEEVLERSAKVYYFDRDSGVAKDISDLDPASEEIGESGWGGLSEFSGRANDAVARAVANGKPGKKS
jgi:AAA15 family ATPase/GTPase